MLTKYSWSPPNIVSEKQKIVHIISIPIYKTEGHLRNKKIWPLKEYDKLLKTFFSVIPTDFSHTNVPMFNQFYPQVTKFCIQIYIFVFYLPVFQAKGRGVDPAQRLSLLLSEFISRCIRQYLFSPKRGPRKRPIFSRPMLYQLLPILSRGMKAYWSNLSREKENE